MKNSNIPRTLHDCMHGYIKTQVLYSCVSLGVFKLLITKKHGLSFRQVSDELRLNSQKSERLLNIATLLGLLTKCNSLYQVSDDCVPYLNNKSEKYQGAFISHMGNSSYSKLQQLSNIVKNTVEPSEDINKKTFDELYEDQAKRDSFMEAMWNIGIEPSRELVKKLDIHKHATLVDIGGGNGSFVIPFALEHMHINATIFDIASIESNAQSKINQHGLQTRVKFKSGNFWNDPFPKSDIFVFGFILSDWSTSNGEKLLRKAKDKLNKNGMIIILEKLFNEEKSDGPLDTSLLDIAMMTEAKGMHRTEIEYKNMLLELGAKSTFTERSAGSKHLIAGNF